MIHTFYIQEYARQRQEELMQMAEQARLLKEAWEETPQEEKTRHPTVRQVLARAPEVYCRLSAWVMGNSPGV